jgi:hypothetical protein
MSRAYIEICVLPCSLRLLAMAQFESVSDDELRRTAAWTAKHMRAMDWVDRHDMWDGAFARWGGRRFCKMVAAHFGPDELLEGTRSGSDPAFIIVMKGKLKRQTSINDYFAKLPRTE